MWEKLHGTHSSYGQQDRQMQEFQTSYEQNKKLLSTNSIYLAKNDPLVKKCREKDAKNLGYPLNNNIRRLETKETLKVKYGGSPRSPLITESDSNRHNTIDFPSLPKKGTKHRKHKSVMGQYASTARPQKDLFVKDIGLAGYSEKVIGEYREQLAKLTDRQSNERLLMEQYVKDFERYSAEEPVEEAVRGEFENAYGDDYMN